MTIEQAYEELGVSRRSSPTKIEQAFKEKSQKLQLQMITGQSLSKRQQATEQMVKLATAHEVLQNSHLKATPKSNSSCSKKPSRARQTFRNPFWLQTRGQPVADFVSAIPLPKPAVIASFVLLILMALSIVRSCATSCINAFAKAQAKVSSYVNSDATPGSVTDRSYPSTADTNEPEAAPSKDIKTQTIENSADKFTSNKTDKNLEQVNRKKIQTYQKEI
jgi:hypothetical protein